MNALPKNRKAGWSAGTESKIILAGFKTGFSGCGYFCLSHL
jgi:hypothetical protein